MSTYQALGHMISAPKHGKYFIPHNAVLKANVDLSNIRVVFDTSSLSPSGRSLNDVLCTDAKFQIELHDILHHFRMYRYILTTDVVNMNRQILIRPEDHVFRHIFWRDSPGAIFKNFNYVPLRTSSTARPF